MKNNNKRGWLRPVSALLLVVMLGALLASCAPADTRKPAETTAAPGTTVIEGDYEESRLPDNLDFGGKTVRLLTEYSNDFYDASYAGSAGENYFAGELTVEELNSTPVNDAVYNREIAVEDQLNIEIERVQTPKGQDIGDYLTNMLMSGTNACEIATVPCQAAYWFMNEVPLFYDLNRSEYLNIDAPWWFKGYTDEASCAGQLHCITGDLSLTLKRCLYVTMYGKKIAEDNHLEDVYQLVEDGKWTLDKLAELSAKVYFDTNGNSEADPEDTFGFVTSQTSVDPLWSAFDIDIISKDPDDLLVYTPQLEKLSTAVEKVGRLFEAKSTYVMGWGEDELYKQFADGGSLFTITRLVKTETEAMRNMQSEYGILPLPKYDESQQGYYTMPSDQFTVFAIPNNTEDPEMSAATLEAMAWYSYRYVTPAYLDLTVKGRYANDAQTRQMIDMILAGFRVDAAWLAARFLGEYPQMWREFASGEATSFSSTVTKRERTIERLLGLINKTAEELE